MSRSKSNSESSESRIAEIQKVQAEILALNTELAAERRLNNTYPVIGEGNLNSKIMFVGEAPGKKESLTGKPFCGASGKFLDVLLNSIGLNRTTVYVTNLVNDRPTDNRDPFPEEIAIYGKFLERQIEIIQPKIIVTLGRLSMKYIFEYVGIGSELLPISKIHGKVFKGKIRKDSTKEKTGYGEVKIIAMYHPAVALYKGSNRKVLLDDFHNIKSLLV